MKRSALLIFSFASALCAQVMPPEPPRGAFAPAGHAMSTVGAGGLSPKEIRIKTHGDKTTMPVELMSPMGVPQPPVYLMSAMFPGNPGIDIDAMSTGNDLLPVTYHMNNAGEMETWIVPASNSWVAFTFSVNSGSKGEPWSPIYPRSIHAGNLKGPGGDLFSYTFPGSAVAQHLIGPHFEQAADDISLASMATPEMDGHDIYISWLFESSALAQWVTSHLNNFYFSLSHDTAGASGVWGVPIEHRNGATIFRMTWNGSAWSVPTVFLTRSSFGFEGGQVVDIDALAIDAVNNKYVISLADGHRDNQFLAGSIPSSGGTDTPRVARTATGEELWRRIGLIEGDRVDAICGFDPKLKMVRARAIGVPGLTGEDPLIAGSARGGGAVGGEFVELTLSGWVGAPARARAEFSVSVNGGPQVLLASIVREARDMNVSVRISGNRFTVGQQLTFYTRYVTATDAHAANETVLDW